MKGNEREDGLVREKAEGYVIPEVLDCEMCWMHMEVTVEELTKAVNAQSDDQSHKSSVHHLLKEHLTAT